MISIRTVIVEENQPTPEQLDRIDGIEGVRRLVQRFDVESVARWLRYIAAEQAIDLEFCIRERDAR